MKDGIETVERAEWLAEKRLSPGVLVLSTSLQLLYMNQRARDLSQHINWSEHGRVAMWILPQLVSELCDEIVPALKIRIQLKDWDQVEVKRMTNDVDRPILVRGLGLPGQSGLQDSRVLIFMEEVGRRTEIGTEQAKQRFHLTDREQAAIHYLTKGFTNKEIANSLGIAEQTVKEHMKRIMQKTKTHTRTGILARVLCA